MHPTLRLRSLRCVIFPVLLIALGGVAGEAGASATSESASAEFLYQLALEYRRNGQLQEAAHELQKALLIEPGHEQAARALEEIQMLMRERRERAISQALAEVGERLARRASTRAIEQVVAEQQQRQLARLLAESGEQPPPPRIAEEPAPLPPPAPLRPGPRAVELPPPPPRDQGPPLRLRDPWINGVTWFYVFGPRGDPEYGALAGAHSLVVEVPRAAGEPARIRVLDADTRDRHDEMAGGWDTSVAFRVFGGSTLLDSRVLDPEAPDGTVAEFGPFPLEQGEPRGEWVLFRVEAEGLEGNDNNLFALEVRPASAQAFSLTPPIRLAEEAGTPMRFFPAVPVGTTRVVIESNYDLDAEGGRVWLARYTRDGRTAGSVPLELSGSGAWSTTAVDVPPDTDGARWTYRLLKGTQRKANMAFRVTDQQGRRLPIYLTEGRTTGTGEEPPTGITRLPDITPAPSCATFTFDASTSYDPDSDRLSYSWEFGDGTTAEGIAVQHTYAAAGEYRVVLEVRDGFCDGCGRARTEQVIQVNTPPRAVLDAPALACAGSAVRFSAAQSSDSPGEALHSRWEFVDGTTAEGAEVTHVYPGGGSFQVQLVVDDGRGTSCSTDLAATTVRVNSPPVAKTDQALSVCAAAPYLPLSVIFSAIGSRDPDLDPLSYRWAFGDGGYGEGAWVSHPYARAGRYTATLTVDDGTGTSCAIATAAVPVHVNHAPAAVVGLDVSGCPGDPIPFDASRSSDPDGDALTYRWDFGDGTTGTGMTAPHRYETPGQFPATVTVDDGSGLDCGTVTATLLADINAPPVARIVVHGEQAAPLAEPRRPASP